MICTVPGCGLPHRSKGFCAAHYSRERRGAEMDRPISDRNADRKRMVTSTVTEDVFRALMADMASNGRASLSAQVRHVLEQWAQNNGGERDGE